MAGFWIRLIRSPSLPGILAAVALAIIETVLDDEK